MTGLDSGSVQLIAFGVGVAILMHLGGSSAWRTGVLIAASIVFILLLGPSPLALAPLGAFVLLGYACVVAIRNDVKYGLLFSVLLLIAGYTWLKRYSILPEASFLSITYTTLGLSYIFFRVLHLVIEAGAPSPARNIRFDHYLAYTLNFTTFISGPIQRFSEFDQQIGQTTPLPLNAAVIGRQIERIVVGFFKVNVLALLFNMVQVDALAELARAGSDLDKVFAAWKLLVCFPFFLYCNFSGYIDIVIAISRLMGVQLPENFDRPFSATSFIDFWNRWHITLSTWLKTYVYNPLLMTLMRSFPHPSLEQAFGILCFFITFFLIGIWHGRTSEFAVFGLLQGGGVAINKLWQVTMTRVLGRKAYRALAQRPAYVVAARGLTFSWFAVSLIWFWADWRQIETAFAGAGAIGWIEAILLLWIVASPVLAIWEWLRPHLLSINLGGTALWQHPYGRTAMVSALATIAFLVTAVLSQPAPGIVYRAF